MYVKQKRGDFKLKKCAYIHFFLKFRLYFVVNLWGTLMLVFCVQRYKAWGE